MKKFGIRGFPTIKMIVNGTTDGQEYSGNRSKDDLLKSLELAKKASEKVYEVQVKALKAKFEVEK